MNEPVLSWAFPELSFLRPAPPARPLADFEMIEMTETIYVEALSRE